MPEVTVIIPVYNVEKYIERCIGSVMMQTYDNTKIECILIDDSSPDGSMAIVRKMIEEYSGGIHFVIVVHKENRGLSEARNTGMRHAHGRYILFLDSDDDLLPHCIERLMEATRQHPGVECVLGNSQNMKEQQSHIVPGKLPLYSDNHACIFTAFLRTDVPVTAWNTLIRKDFIEKNGLTFRRGLLQEDILWSFYLYSRVQSFAFVPTITANYEYNLQSICSTQSNNALKHAKSLIVTCTELLDNFDSDYYIDNTLFIAEYLVRLKYSSVKNKFSSDIDREIKMLCHRLFKQTAKSCRLSLCMFELLTLQPYVNILKIKKVRNNTYRLRDFSRSVSLLFDRLHKHNSHDT